MNIKKQLLLIPAILFLFSGIGLVLLSLNDIYKIEINEQKSLTEAKQKIRVKKSTVELNTIVLQKEQTRSYSFQKGEVIGILEIPNLKAELPIIEGTTEYELQKGVGHYSRTALPGQPDQILLSGHRETVFRHLGELQNGDVLNVIMPYGSYSYEITDSQIVDANDPTVIKSTAPNETLTVSTCYPFSFIGDAPYRYILTAKRTVK